MSCLLLDVLFQVSKAQFQQKGESFDNSKRLKINDSRVKVRHKHTHRHDADTDRDRDTDK